MYRLTANFRPRWTTLLFLAIVLLWFVWLRPVGLGGPAGYIIVSGTSMEPTLQTGDLVITRAQWPYEAGDVVAFRANTSTASPLVIHRIVGGASERGYVTLGDNNADIDPWRPTGEQIVGTAWVHVPGVRTVLIRLQDPLLLASVLSSLTVFLMMLGPDGRDESGVARHRRNRRGVRSA